MLLQRTPKEAGLIGASLKRNCEYKPTFEQQLVNQENILRMLNKLKISGNPYNQFYEKIWIDNSKIYILIQKFEKVTD